MGKQYPKHFREQVLKEVEDIGSVSQVAKRHNICDATKDTTNLNPQIANEPGSPLRTSEH